MKDSLIVNRFNRIVKRAGNAGFVPPFENIRGGMLKESDGFDELDPAVKLLVDQTVHKDGIAAQVAINLALIGIGCSVKDAYYQLYDDIIEARIGLKFDEPFVIDWKSSTGNWYLSKEEPRCNPLVGTVLEGISVSMNVPSRCFGVVSTKEKPVNYTLMSSFVYAMMPNEKSCVHQLGFNYSKDYTNEEMADLALIRRDMGEVVRKHIHQMTSFMGTLLEEREEHEEKEAAGEAGDQDDYEVVDDEPADD